MAAGSAGGDDPKIRAFYSVTDRKVTRRAVADHHRNRQRRNAARALFKEDGVLGGRRNDPTDTAGNQDADTIFVQITFLKIFGEAGASDGFITGRDGVLAKKVHPLRVFKGNVLCNIKVFDLASDLSTVLGSVKFRDGPQPAATFKQSVPER